VYDVKFAGKELAGLEKEGKVKSLRSFRKLKPKVHSAERQRLEMLVGVQKCRQVAKTLKFAHFFATAAAM
jgi:hypothetical protein